MSAEDYIKLRDLEPGTLDTSIPLADINALFGLDENGDPIQTEEE